MPELFEVFTYRLVDMIQRITVGQALLVVGIAVVLSRAAGGRR